MSHQTIFLLVEDEPIDVTLVTRAFGKSGSNCRLEVAGDGVHAKEYLEGKPPYDDRKRFPLPDVILLDIKMPRMNGLEFLKWLREESPQEFRITPVVVMSSSDLPQDVKQAYALGVNSYLVKPVDWTEFQKCMAALNVYWNEVVETPDIKS